MTPRKPLAPGQDEELDRGFPPRCVCGHYMGSHRNLHASCKHCGKAVCAEYRPMEREARQEEGKP